jgi:hypothetical protein
MPDQHHTLRAHFTGLPGITPGRYQILFIHEGKANGFTFTREVLTDSIPQWDGASVFVDHAFWGMPSVRDLGGVISNAAWSEEFSGLTAELTPAGPSKEIIHEAARITMDADVRPNIGFSADMILTADAAGNVTRILQPFSVDLVIDPAFATKFIRSLNSAARGGFVPQSGVPAQAAQGKGAQPNMQKVEPTPKPEPEDVDVPAVNQTRLTLNTLVLDSALAMSDIPDKAKTAIRTSFKSTPAIAPADVAQAIQAWKDSISELTAGEQIVGPARISAMFNSDDQIQAAIDDMVGAPREEGAEKLKVARLTGLKEAYISMTGDRDLIGGFFKDQVQFQHTTSSFPALVANALNKALIREWALLGKAGYDWWTKIVRVEHFETLNTIKWNLFGTIASVPTVEEGAEYTELQLGDNVETSSFVKKGGYIGLTLEAIDRDDGRKLRQVPRELAFASLREISALVAAIFTDNSNVGPTLADGGALFNNTAVTGATGHANLLTTALGNTFAAWDAASAAMYNQPMLVKNATGYYGTGKKMAIEPKYCLVPRALKAAAEALFIPRWAGTIDAAIAASGGPTYGGYIEPVVVPEWTDATDWAAVADPAVMPGIMIGERFGLTPQIFVDGSESDPAMFANDEQRLKVRHIIAVGVADFRPLHKSNVAG